MSGYKQRTTFPKSTDLDDWETDPDHINDIDEISQRWGSKRTIGSINMSKLIDDVNRDHKRLAEENSHPSQRSFLDDFRKKCTTNENHEKNESSHHFERKQESSATSSKQIEKEIITKSSTKTSFISTKGKLIDGVLGGADLRDELTRDTSQIRQPSREDFPPFNGKSAVEPPRSTLTKDPSYMAAYQRAKAKFEAFEREFADVKDSISRKEEMSRRLEGKSSPSARFTKPKTPDMSDFEEFLESQKERRARFDRESLEKEVRKLAEPRSFTPSKPRIFTEKETHREEVVSRFVKHNDQVIEDDTKRKVESTRSSDSDGKAIPVELIDDSRPEKRLLDLLRAHRVHIPANLKLRDLGLFAKTLYDHQAAEKDELSFSDHQLITNIVKVDPGWWEGTTVSRNGVKSRGLFPSNYVEVLNKGT